MRSLFKVVFLLDPTCVSCSTPEANLVLFTHLTILVTANNLADHVFKSQTCDHLINNNTTDPLHGGRIDQKSHV